MNREAVMPGKANSKHAITQILQMEEKNIIEDEQVARILKTVISMIIAGDFDRKRKAKTDIMFLTKVEKQEDVHYQ